MTKEEMILRIDQVADAQRLKIVGDPVRTFEYKEAKEEATAFRDAGYTGEVPATVQCWADAKSWTPQEACDDILRAADQFVTAMQFIRRVRLVGKSAVQETADDAAADFAFNSAIAQLKVIVP